MVQEKVEEKERVILHSDLNNFFASVERALNPDLIGKPIAVCGSVSDRHGIVLAKSEEAKKFGIKTAMTVIEAKKLCPALLIVASHMGEYEKYSRRARAIYADYTDMIEPFGIDEAWIDVTNSTLFGTGEKIADEIRARMKSELNLTCSVGVSFNKVFAKLGSDMKKPDGTTVISRDNFKSRIFSLPVSDLLYVGRSTLPKLNKYNIFTIGDLAAVDCNFLTKKFGKVGEILWLYANGLDDSPVKLFGEEEAAKSVGNSVTTFRDMENIKDVKIVFSYLCDSVAERLSHYGGKANTVTVSIRDNSLSWFSRQKKLLYPSALADDFFKAAVELFEKNYDWHSGVHSIGVSVCDFSDGGEQISIDQDLGLYDKKLELENSMRRVREKYGPYGIRRAVTLCDKGLSGGISHHGHSGGISGRRTDDVNDKQK